MSHPTLPADVPPAETESLSRTFCPLFRRSQFEGHLDHPIPWLWHGYLFRSGLTLLTGQWKIGKSTLLAALLGRLGSGGVLAGHEVKPGRAVVFTEEIAGIWIRRMVRHNIGDAVSFAFRPFPKKPLARQWPLLMEDLRELHQARRIDLVVIDPLAAVLPGKEEGNAAAMTDVLRPLQQLAERGPAVLILHHPRKGRSTGGQGSRGTGALPAFVDILLEMNWPGSTEGETRRRWLTGWSRFEETPRRLLLELSADGTDYTVSQAEDTGQAPPADEVQRVLEDLIRSTPGLTGRELVDRWPEGTPRLSSSGMNRRLLASIRAGQLKRTGNGNRFSPNRYWVAEKEGSDEALPAEERGNGA